MGYKLHETVIKELDNMKYDTTLLDSNKCSDILELYILDLIGVTIVDNGIPLNSNQSVKNKLQNLSLPQLFYMAYKLINLKNGNTMEYSNIENVYKHILRYNRNSYIKSKNANEYYKCISMFKHKMNSKLYSRKRLANNCFVKLTKFVSWRDYCIKENKDGLLTWYDLFYKNFRISDLLSLEDNIKLIGEI